MFGNHRITGTDEAIILELKLTNLTRSPCVPILKAMKTKVLFSVLISIVLPSFFYANILPSGLVFRVKLDRLETPIQSVNFEKYQPVSNHLGDDAFSCELGAYSDFLHAQKANNELKEIGFEHVELIAYFNNRPVSIDDAFTLLDNRNQDDKAALPSISDQKVNEMLAKIEKPDFHYTILMGVYNEQQVNLFFDFPKTVNEKVTNRGHFRYTYGIYYTLQDAKDALGMIYENGIDNAYIIAYDNIERIPLARAMQMEEKFLYDSLANNK